MHMTHRIGMAFLFIFMFTLFACSDNNNQKNDISRISADAISGTVATGQALPSNVTVKDSEGATNSAESNEFGVYSVDITGMSGPFMVQAAGNDDNNTVLYSFAAGEGIANVTPLTNMALVVAMGDADLDGVFENWVQLHHGVEDNLLVTFGDLKTSGPIAGDAEVVAVLDDSGLDDDYNFFTTPFRADGSDVDSVLDQLAVDVSDNGNVNIDVTPTGNNDGDGTSTPGNQSGDDVNIDIDEESRWNRTVTSTIPGGNADTTMGADEISGENVPGNAGDLEHAAEHVVDQALADADINRDLNYALDASRLSVTGDGAVGTVITAEFDVSFNAEEDGPQLDPATITARWERVE